MRPLNRPMFKYGGPIKEGIMDGMREPKKDGNIVGGKQSPLLAGAHPLKDAEGREHHFLPALYAAGLGALNIGRAGLALGREYLSINNSKLKKGVKLLFFFSEIFPKKFEYEFESELKTAKIDGD